jgi:hypothetical protein
MGRGGNGWVGVRSAALTNFTLGLIQIFTLGLIQVELNELRLYVSAWGSAFGV